MEKDWNFDMCINCKNFRTSTDIKKRWRCKLNVDAEYRNNFHMIWLMENAHNSGILSGENPDKVNIEYVGKRKNRKVK